MLKVLKTVLLTVTFASSVSLAATIRLRTGEVLVGKVLKIDFEKVKAKIYFPRIGEVTFKRESTDPAWFYELLSQRIPEGDAALRLKLAEFCLREGLLAQAAFEARVAAEIESKYSKKAEIIEKKAIEGISNGLLDNARTYIALEKPGMARLYLEALIQRYSATKAAKKAASLLKELPAASKESPTELVVDSRGKEKIRADLKQALRYMEKADKLTGSLKRHYRGRRDESLLRQAELIYGRAFSILKATSKKKTDDEVLNEVIKKQVKKARQRLVRTYLELGSLYLSQGAVTMAERYCSAACDLDPEGKELHSLHKKILQAKVLLHLGS